MSRLQDQFIDDDEEETCPLCVEELDLTDKGFRPCPCGYQICQFCYHNVKNNMNGLCPACRRPYNDNDIEWKVVTPEETAAHKARQAQKQKKTQAMLQKEKQKAEAENLSRKHLAGMRVVQKNLVYVTGLSPTTQEDQLLATLRGEQYFGQYGKIIKIVVSKARDTSHPNSVGVYVTYERKEDAASCIAAVDGTKNGDRTLRAQFGTTKYCSAYLRGETCSNRNCMFLHEPGEANESYSRADLSSLNAGSSQHGGARPPPPQSQQPVSAAQPMTRQGSGDQPLADAPDRPALPSTASWASRPQPHSGRAETQSTGTTVESPPPVTATPALQSEQPAEPAESSPADQAEPEFAEISPQPAAVQPRKTQISPLELLLRNFKIDDFKLVWSTNGIPQTDLDIISNYPPLFDQTGGARRRVRKQREEEQRRMEQETQAYQQPPAVEPDDNPEMSGSLQLGGEPEERQNVNQIQGAIQPPGEGGLDQRFQFGGGVASPGISDRGLTPQQHQQMLLQTLKPNTIGTYSGTQQSTAFSAPLQQQSSQPLGHQRNVSRYSFANDSSSASAAVKPVANPKLMNQQSSMMPPAGGNHFSAQHQQPHGQFYSSNVTGPPPGLKTTGTPPVSGNLTFGQGHGFATGGIQYSAGTPRNQQDNYYRELMRGRDGAAGGVDAKRELHSFPNYNNTHPNAAYPPAQSNAFPASPYPSLGAYGDGEKQRKKKGKKHRHANTSSSSGGGVVDVADPSASHLLQARLHQGPSGLGGNAFADDTEFPPLAPSRHHSIASRISLLDESRTSTPPIPPGFGGQLANENRRSTPTVPPGLTRPNALPDLEGSSSRPTSRPSSRASLRRTASQILPALPLRPGTPARPTPSRKQTREEEDIALPDETPTRPSRTTSSHLKHDLSAEAAEESKMGAGSEPVQSTTDGVGHLSDKADEHFGAPPTQPDDSNVDIIKSVATASEASARVPSEAQSSSSVVAKAKVESAKKAESSAIDTSKRKHPGKLDITAAVMKQKQEPHVVSSETPIEAGTPGRASHAVSQTPSTKLPESPSVASPAIKTVPRTLRVVQTPKADTPPPKEFTLPTIKSIAAHKLPSRQPSVGSIDMPGTPSSEHVSISDNVSLTSTSVSRANSPPPMASRVGSAPVRTKTKSQMKKERQERAKAMEEEKAKVEEAADEEPAQEAIVSRKKKAKKEKEPRPAKPKAVAPTATADSTPTASRPASPGKTTAEFSPVADTASSTPKEVKPATPTRSMRAPPPPMQPPYQPSPPPTPTLTAAQLIAEIKAAAPELQKSVESLFRVANSHHFKAPQHTSQKDLLAGWKSDFNIKLTKEEIHDLLNGKVAAIQRGSDNDNRTFDRHTVTPSGAHLRALTRELELRFLELEKALRDMPEEFRFRPSKPQNEMKLPSFDLEKLRRDIENSGGRGVSVMEQMVQDGSTMKKGAFLVDEASKYINEFVMPPVTPPPSAGRNVNVQATGHAQAVQSQNGDGSMNVPPMDIADRQLNDAKRVADEKEHALRKAMKKNKRLAGLA